MSEPIEIDSERPPYEEYISFMHSFEHPGRSVVMIHVRQDEEPVFKEPGTFVWKAKTPDQKNVTYDVRLGEPNKFESFSDYFRHFFYGPDPIQDIVMSF